jgi:hypothetical protein
MKHLIFTLLFVLINYNVADSNSINSFQQDIEIEIENIFENSEEIAFKNDKEEILPALLIIAGIVTNIAISHAKTEICKGIVNKKELKRINKHLRKKEIDFQVTEANRDVFCNSIDLVTGGFTKAFTSKGATKIYLKIGEKFCSCLHYIASGLKNYFTGKPFKSTILLEKAKVYGNKLKVEKMTFSLSHQEMKEAAHAAMAILELYGYIMPFTVEEDENYSNITIEKEHVINGENLEDISEKKGWVSYGNDCSCDFSEREIRKGVVNKILGPHNYYASSYIEYENFNSVYLSSSWTSCAHVAYQVQNGEVYLGAKYQGLHSLEKHIPISYNDNFEIKIKMRVIDVNSRIGILFGNNSGSSYNFFIQPSSNSFWISNQGAGANIINKYIGNINNYSNVLKVREINKIWYFYVNDKLVYQHNRLSNINIVGVNFMGASNPIIDYVQVSKLTQK